jgi:hypothetical protein
MEVRAVLPAYNVMTRGCVGVPPLKMYILTPRIFVGVRRPRNRIPVHLNGSRVDVDGTTRSTTTPLSTDDPPEYVASACWTARHGRLDVFDGTVVQLVPL